MARPARPWFRFYTEAFHDPKLRRLTPAHRWLWCAVLGIARQSCTPGHLLVSELEGYTVDDIADYAALTPAVVREGIERFVRAGMLERDENLGAWFVPRWGERQYESDDVTARTQRFRERRRNVPETAEGTPPETEAETDTSPPAPRKSGGRRRSNEPSGDLPEFNLPEFGDPIAPRDVVRELRKGVAS